MLFVNSVLKTIALSNFKKRNLTVKVMNRDFSYVFLGKCTNVELKTRWIWRVAFNHYSKYVAVDSLVLKKNKRFISQCIAVVRFWIISDHESNTRTGTKMPFKIISNLKPGNRQNFTTNTKISNVLLIIILSRLQWIIIGKVSWILSA